MYRPLSLFIGLRSLKSKQHSHFISFIAGISMLGLTLGVAVLITVLSVINGFEQQMKEKILGIVAHASVQSSQPIKDWKAVGEQIQQNDPNVIATAPFTRMQGMISNNEQILSLMITGIVPDEEKKVAALADNMIQGDYNSLKQDDYNIILGQAFVEKMGLKLGDKVTVILPESSKNASGITPKFQTFTLTGIYHISNQADRWLAYVNIESSRSLLNLPEGAQGIRLKLDNVFLAPQDAQKAASLQPDFRPENWTKTHGSIYRSIQMERAMVGLLLFLIILVAGFNIVSSLIMVIVDKKREIAILKTVGTSPKTIRHIFMIQGTMIGIIGTLSGTVLGLILSWNITRLSRVVNDTFDLHLFDRYFFSALPVDIHAMDIVLINIVALAISILATIYPAGRASKVQPALALSGE